MNDWKPGDVAMVHNQWGVWNRAICAVRRGHRGLVWSFGVADDFIPLVDGPDTRPLVVIDPEDAEQVERFSTTLLGTGIGSTNFMVERLQERLREFASPTPPKPDEPTGLGAVVEDAEGLWWVCAVHENRDRWYNPLGGGWCDYADIDVVAVVNPGQDRRA